MGLDTTHGCWHGAYSAFMRWREELAHVAGLPPLELMEGFFERGSYRDPFRDHAERWKDLGGADRFYRSLPIRWDSLRPSALHELLFHSDCEGEIPAERCAPIADALEELLPRLPAGEAGGHIGNWRDKTQTFIDGLRKAAAAGEKVEFG